MPLFDQPDRRFAEFHAANPHVYAALRRFALEARRGGIRRIGIRMVWERMRWHIETERPEGEWRLNNNYTRHYARLLMKQEPELDGLFETRDRA